MKPDSIYVDSIKVSAGPFTVRTGWKSGAVISRRVNDVRTTEWHMNLKDMELLFFVLGEYLYMKSRKMPDSNEDWQEGFDTMSAAESEDWTKWLTEEERRRWGVAQDYSIYTPPAWLREALCSLAALRALVAEKDKALRTYGVHMTGDCLGSRRECICSFSAALALAEDEMLERLEEK